MAATRHSCRPHPQDIATLSTSGVPAPLRQRAVPHPALAEAHCCSKLTRSPTCCRARSPSRAHDQAANGRTASEPARHQEMLTHATLRRRATKAPAPAPAPAAASLPHRPGAWGAAGGVHTCPRRHTHRGWSCNPCPSHRPSSSYYLPCCQAWALAMLRRRAGAARAEMLLATARARHSSSSSTAIAQIAHRVFQAPLCIEILTKIWATNAAQRRRRSRGRSHGSLCQRPVVPPCEPASGSACMPTSRA